MTNVKCFKIRLVFIKPLCYSVPYGNNYLQIFSISSVRNISDFTRRTFLLIEFPCASSRNPLTSAILWGSSLAMASSSSVTTALHTVIYGTSIIRAPRASQQVHCRLLLAHCYVWILLTVTLDLAGGEAVTLGQGQQAEQDKRLRQHLFN